MKMEFYHYYEITYSFIKKFTSKPNSSFLFFIKELRKIFSVSKYSHFEQPYKTQFHEGIQIERRAVAS